LRRGGWAGGEAQIQPPRRGDQYLFLDDGADRDTPPPRLVRQSMTGSPTFSSEIAEIPCAAYRRPSVTNVHSFTDTNLPPHTSA
jgi:hypothetical protein